MFFFGTGGLTFLVRVMSDMAHHNLEFAWSEVITIANLFLPVATVHVHPVHMHNNNNNNNNNIQTYIYVYFWRTG